MVDGVAPPAVFRACVFHSCPFQDHLPVSRVFVKGGRLVTPGTVSPLRGRVAVAFDLPGGNPVALPAGFPEHAAMDIEVAGGAEERLVQKCVVHSRNARIENTVLLVAAKTFLFCLVKTDHPGEPCDVAEIMATQTPLLRNAFPRNVAVSAVQIAVRRAERSGLSGLVIGNKPPCEGHHRKPDQNLDCFPNQSHRMP